MSISSPPPPQSGAIGRKRLIWLKYYNVMKQQIRFTLGLTTAKNTDYKKKRFKWKLFRIKLPTKMSVGAYVYLPQEWYNWGGGVKDCHV